MLGGVGSGKSHVARRTAALSGAPIVDADALAHQALATAAADGSLAGALGEAFVRDGKPDTAALGARAFDDPAFLEALEALLHPPVHVAILEALEAFHSDPEAPLLILDVPLLIEVGLDRRCDALWYVETPDALRAERAAARGLSPETIRKRESFQTPLARKKARADRVIQNDAEPHALDDQIRAGLQALGIPTHSIKDPASPTGESRS